MNAVRIGLADALTAAVARGAVFNKAYRIKPDTQLRQRMDKIKVAFLPDPNNPYCLYSELLNTFGAAQALVIANKFDIRRPPQADGEGR